MHKKILAALLVTILGVGALTGCGSTKQKSEVKADETVKETAEETAAETVKETAAETAKEPEEQLEVHLGDQPSFFILKVAEENGYFEEEFEGTGVSIVVDNFVNQGSAIVEAMNAGDLELGVIGTMPLVTAAANGSQFVAISSVNLSENGFKLYAGPDTGIEKVEDFKGKKIAVKFSSNEHEMLLTLLKKAGLSDTDVEIVNMSSDDGLNSLISGDVSGAVLRGDQLKAADESGAVVVADNSETGIVPNYLVGRKDFTEEHPEVVTGVLKVLEKTKQWIDENPDETVAIFSDQTGIDEDTARVSFESRDRSISIDEEKFAAPIRRTIEFLVSQGTIEDTLTAEDIIDTGYYEQSGISES